MGLRLGGRVALITGAADRLGRAAALALADAGADIAVHYRNSRAPAEALAGTIRSKNRAAWTVCGDLAQPAGCETVWAEALRVCGRPVGILVNNASVFDPSRLADAPVAEFERNMQINAYAPLLLSRAFAAQFSGKDSAGQDPCIVNMLDSRPLAGVDSVHAAYALSKQALHALTQTMAVEFAPAVRVNGVAPGLILPPRGEGAEYLQKLAHTNPLNRIGSAEGIAEAVVFLATSDFVTGQVIFVDGGRHLRG